MKTDGQLLILSLGRRGGSVRYATSMIEAMERVPKDVFVSRYSQERSPVGGVAIPTYRNKWEFIVSSILVLPILWFYVLMGLFKKGYKALYTPYTHYWNALFVWTFKCFGVKTFSTVHDGIPHIGDGNWWQRMINRYTLRHSEHLVFLSQHVRQFLKNKIGFEGESTVIPHGFLQVQGVVPVDRILPERANLLFLGRVCHYKGVDLLLESLNRLDSNRINQCVIAGKVSVDLKHLKDFKTEVPVQWIDKWLSEEEMAHYIQRADIIVLPYREATQSGVVTLGISSGLPMVISRVGGLVEQCDEDECVWVEPTCDDLAVGIDGLLNDPELYQLIQENLKLKRSSNNWSMIATDLMNCINNN